MNSQSLPEKLILASGSKYRQQLLQRLGIAFDCHAPQIDESSGDHEAPIELVRRLAALKAEAVSREFPRAIVIGSDQLAVFDGNVIGKPGSYKNALRQLTTFSGQTVEFLTAVSVQCLESGFEEQHTDSTQVCFSNLKTEQIERYLEKEKPFDCTGSFKAESLGIVLFDQINSTDPTALIGLPLIATATMLRRAGLQLP